MKHPFLLTLFIFFTTLSGFSQTGLIKGTITDKKTRETIVGANVFLQGTTIGKSTDLNGEYLIENIKPGTYTVIVSMISYKKIMFENVTVSKNKITLLNAEMEEETVQMKEVVVVERKTTNTEISIVNSIRNSSIIANGVSGQQIAKTQDRDASEIIKRIPGVTLFDNRFVIVRGLAQRYNTVWMNNASTPSSEADMKAFSFDVIPSSLIDNIMVYKTPSPEFPADFAGAFIEVKTKNTPATNSLEFSYSASCREGTTFQSFSKYKGGSLDFLGIDDGTRALPPGFPSSNEFKHLSSSFYPNDLNTVIDLSRSINKTWTASSGTALNDNRLSMAKTTKFKIGKMEVGNITSLNYSNVFQGYEIHRMDFQVYNFEEDKSNPNFDFLDRQYTRTARTGVLFNWSFILNPHNKIEFRNLLNQMGYSRTMIREGEEYYSSQKIRSYEYSFLSRTTYAGQLGGEHLFRNDRSKLNWTLGYSYSNRKEPNQKRLTTILNTTQGDPHFNEYGLALGNTASPKYAGIVYQHLGEHIFNANVNYHHSFEIGNLKPELITGIYYEYKTRKFNARLLGFRKSNESLFNQDLPYMSFDSIFTDKNINSTDGIKLAETTNPSDSYTAYNNQIAGFITLKLPLGSRFTIYGGARVEKNRQHLDSYSSDLSSKSIQYDADKTNIFPSVNLSYDLTETSLLRLAYGKTINRPEFRETAPFNFYIFQENASYIGNPNLRDAIIHNLDFRYEWYPSLSEMINLGLFYKKFDHPIEISYINSGSGLAYGPVNAEGATNFGAELEIRKSFSSWKNKSGILHTFRDFTLVMNASWIRSKVTFPAGSPERNRTLQGQSPYIVNTGLYYQNDKSNWTASLLYNVMGKRIMIVGQAMQNPKEDIPDIYEMPRHSMDLTLAKKIGKHLQIKGGIQDLLNQKIRYQQQIKFDKPGVGNVERQQTTLSYRPGRYYSLGITLLF